ncbi:MAG: VCBS repeat-containing protein, partial [Saprospiraceae bacterium]|nr:VCBS repeat-containing protein [Saprospiraceae bacterium]
MLLRLYSFLLIAITLAACKKEEYLFEKIPAARSGVHFNNQLNPNKEFNAFTFTNFYNGGGVGIGDFNHDGLPDLFFTGNQVSSALYLNKGNFQFEDITEKAGVATNRWCSGVCVVDINQDGWDDIYISVAKASGLKDSHNLLFINQKTDIPT